MSCILHYINFISSPDDKQRSRCRRSSLFLIHYSQLNGQLALRIGDNRIRKLAHNVQAVVLNVVHPINVVVQFVHRMRQQFAVALLELREMHRDATQFRRADRREVGRVGEEDAPAAGTGGENLQC